MARELESVQAKTREGPACSPPSAQAAMRTRQVRLGVWIESVSLLWMMIEASVAIGVGYATSSVSLQGFGFDSVLELITGVVLLWRLLVEQRGATVAAVERAERTASWIAAIGLFVLAAYIIANTASTLFTRSRPEASWWGVSLATAAAIIMLLLWQGKLRVARRIGSAALKADAVCSVTCAYMSLTLLAGLSLNALFGWWWADPLAALVLVYFIVQEGRETLHEARTGQTCNCCND